MSRSAFGLVAPGCTVAAFGAATASTIDDHFRVYHSMPVGQASVRFSEQDIEFDAHIDVAVIGAGACGLIAALAAAEAGAAAVAFEADATPSGSTGLSSGMIPACATRFQSARGVDDSVALFAADIMRKNRREAVPDIVDAVCRESGPVVEWLADRHDVPLGLVDGFLYPGHSALRMHAPPGRTGAELMGALLTAAAREEIDIVTDAPVNRLVARPDGAVSGFEIDRPDGRTERIGCATLVLACNGYGGNPDMVSAYLPEMSDALYFGHAGNRGHAVLWGRALGAGTADLGAYQGHGSVAHPHGALISWALMMEGGIQVNADGQRFSNEHGGYSEQAVHVLSQPGKCAWNIFDERLHHLGLQFDDYRAAVDSGAVIAAPDLAGLVEKTGLPEPPLRTTLDACTALARGEGEDRFGRDFTTAPPLSPPYHAVRVTGALFHTQGGLEIDTRARVLKPDGQPLPNLYAGGGAARGVSGAHVWGYLSGNGLLTAVTLGRIAGRHAARQALTTSTMQHR